MDLTPFALERFLAQHEFNARYLLSASDCAGLAMADLVAGAEPDLEEQWRGLRLGYTDSRGSPELRAEIATLYQSVDPERVLIAAPQEIIFLAMNALLEPGDHVVCTFPGYQSLYQLALSFGCDVTFWEPSEAEGWRFDPDRLQEMLHPNTKLVVWNFPHNPTGALPTLDDFARMLASVRAAGAWVFSDEMYRLLEPSPDVCLPAAVDQYEKAVSFSGVSKVFGLAGLRIGWAATHDLPLLRRMMGLKDYTTICSSAPSELLALMALRAREAILATHRARVGENLGLAGRFFARHTSQFGWVPPKAGTICFPRLLAGGPEGQLSGWPSGAADFCTRVLRDAGVLLLPSTLFSYGEEHFRLGLGRADFPDGLDALDAYVSGLAARPGSDKGYYPRRWA